jgi:hypothetical protein
MSMETCLPPPPAACHAERGKNELAEEEKCIQEKSGCIALMDGVREREREQCAGCTYIRRMKC